MRKRIAALCACICLLLLASTLPASAAKVISNQPKPTRALEGETASFAVKIPAPMKYLCTYQWQMRRTTDKDYQDIEGATEDTYTTGPLTAADNHSRYRCRVSYYATVPTQGKLTRETSRSANLIVKSGIEITHQPRAARATKGDTVTYTVKAEGVNALRYQWQVRLSGENIYRNIAGATLPTLTLHGVRNGDKHNRYRCVITSETGFKAVSESANLLVFPQNKRLAG